ncbi:MAG: hypothetical protein LKE89_04285 [Lactobacillaceae bacterium]|jgi:hypothetical protein|nr:hypothetical protein [Lactobacillaceae bacterium]
MISEQNIAFFITDNGFGHIMRNIPVIKWLLENSKVNIVLVSGSDQIRAADNYLVSELTDELRWQSRIKYISMAMEPGILMKSGSLEIDWDGLREQLKQYFHDFPKLMNIAKEIFIEQQIDTVVSDIVPWIFPVAKKLAIHSILMASYTWIEEYEPYLEPEFITPFKDCYALAERVVMYSLVTEPTRKRFAEKALHVDLCARPFHDQIIKKLTTNFNLNSTIFISTGFRNSSLYGTLDVSELPYNFITTFGVSLAGKNVLHLSANVINTQDYIAASDICVVKAGWATLAEGLLAKKKMILIERPDAVEDSMYIKQLTQKKIAYSISDRSITTVDQLQQALGSALQYDCQSRCLNNDYQKIGMLLLENCSDQ